MFSAMLVAKNSLSKMSQMKQFSMLKRLCKIVILDINRKSIKNYVIIIWLQI